MMKSRSLIIVVAAIMFVQTAAFAGVVGQWSFDADASDSVGSLDGTLVGGATISTGAKVGAGCLYVNGVDGFAQILGQDNFTVPTTLPTGSSARTIAFFMKAESGATGNPTMFSYGNAPSNPGGSRFDILLSTASQLRVEMSGNPSGAYTYTEDYSGEWVHVAVVYSPGLVETFVNGVSVGTVADGAPLITTGGLTSDTVPFVFSVGRSFNDTTRFFKGSIDELQIYDNALTASEIQTLASVPEPTTIALLAIGSIGMVIRRRK